MRLSLRRRAELDIAEAFEWYESRRAGFGEDFLASVDACFERLRREPQIYPAVLDPVHRAPLHRFPYATYYLVRPDHVDVLAVYHGRRRPRRFTNA